MKIRIEIDENLEEQEVIIRAPAWNEEVTALKERIAGEYKMPSVLNVRQKERDFFIPFHDILFFETENKVISKSTIVNCSHIFSITRNLTASSMVEFRDSHKQVYVSRQYYKMLRDYMAEKRRG